MWRLEDDVSDDCAEAEVDTPRLQELADWLDDRMMPIVWKMVKRLSIVDLVHIGHEPSQAAAELDSTVPGLEAETSHHQNRSVCIDNEDAHPAGLQPTYVVARVSQ